jgi:hypothetical protein
MQRECTNLPLPELDLHFGVSQAGLQGARGLAVICERREGEQAVMVIGRGGGGT